MKKFITLLCLCIFLIGTTLTTSSCNRDANCPAYGTTKSKSRKDGSFSGKRGKTNLFPKKMRKKK